MASCDCKPGLFPNPDTITGCIDPCNPAPCGPGTICTTSNEGVAICECKSGLVPNPDTFTGCIERNPCDSNPCGPGMNCFQVG